MTDGRHLLVIGGIALALWGMGYGLWYAVFAEHQALESIGASLATGFSAAAERNNTTADSALLQYRAAKYNYDRQVDVHGHWIGLAMLLIVVGIAYDCVVLSRNLKFAAALGLLLGAFLFPLGVLLETVSRGPIPKAVAVLGSALVIGSLAAITYGFARQASAARD